MQFGVLGPVEIRVGERTLDAGHARQRAVLAVLLLDLGHVVQAELLIDRVWGEDPPPAVRNALYGYIARLRAMLAGAADGVTLSRRQGGYVLQADAGQLDLHRFRSLIRQSTSAANDDAAEKLLQEALGLWHGPALADVDSPWLTAMRDTLELERHAAQLDLNDVRLRQGQHAMLAAELVTQTAANPADERLIGQLMLALYRSGRQADALRWFDQTRRYLAGELGTNPAPQLRELHQQILRADPALSLPPQVTGGKPTQPVPHELPADVAAFTGRAAELAELDRLLLGPGIGAVDERPTAAVISAVSGTAGVGKTALAVHWAHHAAGSFPAGQLYVNLRGYDPDQPTPATDALAGFLRSLGVPGQDIPPDEADRAARYRSLLAGTRTLVVLDNAATVEQVRPLLPGHPECTVVVTSRDSLAGLIARDGARRLDLDLLPLDDAIALLRELVGVRVDAEPGAAAALAEQCARLPLALRVAAELAATRPDVPLAKLVAELSDQQRRLDLLSVGGDPRTAVRAVFSWSYGQLDDSSARVFRLAGLHPGGYFDAYSVAALADAGLDEALRLLTTLARGHLIQPAAQGRYGMHDLLRAYARNLAGTHDGLDEERVALRRLFDFYLHTAAAAMDTLFPGERERRPRIPEPDTPVPPLADQIAARNWLNAERTAVNEVVRQAAEYGWPTHATRMAATLYRYLLDGGFLTEARSMHTYARCAARASGDRTAEATALNDLGTTKWQEGRFQEAVADLQESLGLSVDVADRRVQARVNANLGIVYLEQGRVQEAISHFRESLELNRELGFVTGQASARIGIGNCHVRQGRFEDASDSFREALKLSRAAGDRSGEARALNNLGQTAEAHGRDDDAADYYRQVLVLCRQTGYRTAEASALANLGELYGQLGQYPQAYDHLNAALALHREIGFRTGEVADLNGLGTTLRMQGRPGDARSLHVTALELAEQTGHAYEQARAHDGLGHCYLADDDRTLARDHWQQALVLYTELAAPEADKVRGQLHALDGGKSVEG
jgi:DNA-binding SARP family transcriptional activator/Tfp pilus assembly protein PilF